MIIKNAKNWKQMNGDTTLEKQLNSFLTCQFVLSKDVPSDECLSEARKIIKMVEVYYGFKHPRGYKAAIQATKRLRKTLDKLSFKNKE